MEEYNEREMARMRKSIILCVALMMILSMPTAMAAITVDGYMSTDEWNESWAFGQDNATTYDPNGPFGDRLVIRQGGYEYPLVVTNTWNDVDPKNDSGPTFDVSMATLGDSSGFDIATIYGHYNPITDTIYGLTVVYGIPGDVDGDGNIDGLEPADQLGDDGPAGTGLGPTEYWNLRVIQDSIATDINLINNNWSISGNAIEYDDIEAKFTSNQTNSVYEISMRNVSESYSVAPGAVLAMQLIAGSSADGLGEDTAVVFIRIPNPDIQIVKYVQDMDGDWHNANTPATGPLMENGSAVSWKYVIENIGDEPLTNVVVTDDQSVVVSGQQNTLAVGEIVEYFADGTVSDPCESYRNVGRVDGIGAVTGLMVTDTDPAHYRCEIPVPALTPTGLLGLIGVLGIIGIIGVKRRD